MAITEQIEQDVREAMKARDALRTEVLRGLRSAFTNELVSAGKKPTDTLPDADALAVIKRQVKQRDDSIEQYSNAGRDELADKEKQEREILAAYLPETMGRDEIETAVRSKMEALDITDPSQKGQLIGAVMKEIGDRADGADVKAVVEELLA